MQIRFYISGIALLLAACMAVYTDQNNSPVKTGAEILLENHLDELHGKRVGLVMNPTSRVGDVHMVDTLRAAGVNVSALFAPEHGFRGEAGAGELIEDGIDSQTGLPVFSLYGSTRKPTPEMLEHADILLFDVQDAGVRYYTYIATLGLVLEAAAEADIPVWILDRPNPLGGNYVSGWILEEEFTSFVGPFPVPAVHGLTMGEIGLMMSGENWIDVENSPQLKVIEMEGWKRNMIWPDTRLPWIAPSPNLGMFEQAFLYSGTVFFEGTDLSEGRGTDKPFLVLGSPETQISDENLDFLNNLSGQFTVNRTDFTPRSLPGKAPYPKHQDSLSRGIEIEISGFDFDPFRTGLMILRTLVEATPDAEIKPFMYNLAGTRKIDAVLKGEVDPFEIDFELDAYLEKRKPYLLYD